MLFEFQYNVAERKRYDQLNHSHAISPTTFALVWCLCFVPTVLCLVWMKMWAVVITGIVLILMASLVPAIIKFRSTKREFPRSIEFTSVGKCETIGASRGFVKWDSVDEVIETKDDFLFSRNHRFTMLPKRVIDEDQLEPLRNKIRLWRNQPEASNQPIEMFGRLFNAELPMPTWQFALGREELMAATKSTSIKMLNEDTFSFKDVEAANKPRRRWIKYLVIGLCLKLLFWLLLASLPPNRIDLAPIVLFLCFNPLVLLFAMAWWIRRRGISAVPRFRADHYQVRLLDGGWAVGNEDVVVFNAWNERSILYVAKEFVGIRSDAAVIHILPAHAFGGIDGVWQFIDKAIRLKKDWLHRKSEDETDVQEAEALDNGEDGTNLVNPYRSPSVKIR